MKLSTRRIASSTALLVGLLFACAVARAEVLPWRGTLAFDLLDPGLPAPAVVGSGLAIATGNGAGSLGTLRIRGGLSAATTVLVTDPASLPLTGLVLDATLGIATLRPVHPAPPTGPALTSRTLPIHGAVRLCLLGCDAFSLPLVGKAGASGLGVGGLLTAGGPVGPLRMSLEGAPWTVRTAWVPVQTTSGASVSVPGFGFVHGPLSFTGSTAASGGALQLVTPLAVSSIGGPELRGFASLTLHFVPEPGPPALLAAGVAGLLALAFARRRLRSQETSTCTGSRAAPSVAPSRPPSPPSRSPSGPASRALPSSRARGYRAPRR